MHKEKPHYFSTSVQTQFITYQLKKASVLSLCGICCLFCPSFLKTTPYEVSPLAFALALGLIAKGFIPYKKLRHLELHPQILVLSETHLELYYKNTCLQSIPRKTIKEAHYIETKTSYGILLKLKQGHNAHSDNKKTVDSLFLPYFSKKTSESLLQAIGLKKHRIRS